MARTTVSTTVQRIRRQLSSGLRNETNYLSAAINMFDTTLSLSLPITAGLTVGSIIYVDTEAMLVTAVSSANSTVTVRRPHLDSTSATHAINAEVVINPRFSPLDIYDALQDEIASYGPQLYRVDTAEFSVADAADTITLSADWADCYGVIDVRRKSTESDVTAWPRVNVRFQRLGPSAFGGASILRIITPTEASTVYVQVARPFVLTGFNAATDLKTDVLLPESMLDVLSMGTKMRLLVDSENSRNGRNIQDEPRRAEETPLGAVVQPFQFNNAVYRNRKQEEVNKLRALWPIRFA